LIMYWGCNVFGMGVWPLTREYREFYPTYGEDLKDRNPAGYGYRLTHPWFTNEGGLRSA
jgi:hypothetical protein